MAAIEYGIDGNGRKVSPEAAWSGRTYICPYCGMHIHVRKGHVKVDYFAHDRIEDRTPEQMMCPGYTGEGKDSVSNPVDQVYITNGGIPLYLSKISDEYFELFAIFPRLSDKTMDILRRENAKVEITGNGRGKRYSAWAIRKHRITDNSSRYNVRVTGISQRIEEVHHKWEWGIRGLDIGQDIFQAHLEGGYRLARHADVVVGKDYYYVYGDTKLPSEKGMKFTAVGTLKLSNGWSTRDYKVARFVIEEATEAAVSFIQTKGYQLIQDSDEIIPLWPPAVIEGKELHYAADAKNAYFYHPIHARQKIYDITSHGMVPVYEKDNIFWTRTDAATLILTDYDFNKFSREIRYMLLAGKYEQAEADYEPRSYIKRNTEEYEIADGITEEFYKPETFIVSDDQFNLILMRDYVIRLSTRRSLDGLSRNDKLVLSYRGFGNRIIKSDYVEENRRQYGADTVVTPDDALISMFVSQAGRYIPYDNRLDWILLKTSDQSMLYQLVRRWKYNNKMPATALLLSEQLRRRIDERH